MPERRANQPVNAESSDDDIRDRAGELYERDGELEIDNEAEVSRGDVPKTPEHRCACITVDIQAAHWSNCPNRENRVETSDDLG